MPRVFLIGSAVLGCVAGCVSNPPPQYPPPGPPPATMTGDQSAQQGGPPPGGTTASPPAGGSEEVPIDPAKEMPANTLTTNATLAGFEQPAKVMIDGRADIFSSAMKAADKDRGGMLPAAITLVPGGTTVTFPRVVGLAGCQSDASFGADGGSCAGGITDIESAGVIAGIVAHDRTLFLVGVFMGPKAPAKAPERLDFSPGKQGVAFESLKPQVGQVFFIGDGKTATGSGKEQKFIVPAGATMLYLGYADAYAFQGPPSYYSDNTGGLNVTVAEHKE